MSDSRSEREARERRILDAAADLIIRQGYDKTTMGDIADEAGVSRGIVYLHFESKDSLFEAVVFREMSLYGQTWLDHIESDPRGGTVGGVYRAVLHAVNRRPLIQSIMRRDRKVWGNYLRKPNNLFAAMQSGSLWADTLRAMQAAGAVRPDVDVGAMAHVMDIMAYGLLVISEYRNPDELPSFDVLMEAMADVMDRVLTPEDGGNSEAGKELIRRLAASARARLQSPAGDRR